MTEEEMKVSDAVFEENTEQVDDLGVDDELIEEDESLRDVDCLGDDLGMENPTDCCADAGSIRNGILFEAAVGASREIEFIADLGAKCRMELFELILKADLDKEKIKEKVRSLQEFLVASEHRTDELTARIERLTKG